MCLKVLKLVKLLPCIFSMLPSIKPVVESCLISARNQKKSNGKEYRMARPIEPTPVLEGRDAEQFLASVRNDQPVSDDRQRWMDDLVRQSRIAEKNR